MNNWLVYGIGFLAQILFSGRLLVQWILSEKYKRIVTPSLFWKLSLFASFLLFVYGHLRDDFAIMMGQALTYFIYIRNLQLQGEWQKSPKLLRWFLLVFPVFIVIYAYNNGDYDLQELFHNEDIPFLVIGFRYYFPVTFYFSLYLSVVAFRKKKILPSPCWILALKRCRSITYSYLRYF